MTLFSKRAVARSLVLTGADAIDEQHYVAIGGVEQWIGIRGEGRANPVLLIVHGGPGSPYSIFTPVIRGWERYFTVVQWDRRGVGRTRGRSDEFMAYDAYALGTDFAVPFFLFPGDQDVLTLTTLAREYFEAVSAPVKDFRLVQGAGHFAAFTQPEQFLGHLVDGVRAVVSA